MLIGMASKIPFTGFAYHLFPVSLAGLIIAYLVLRLVYGKELTGDQFSVEVSHDVKIFKPLFLLQDDPKYPGERPFATYLGYRYQGGYSDHLPVILDLIRK